MSDFIAERPTVEDWNEEISHLAADRDFVWFCNGCQEFHAGWNDQIVYCPNEAEGENEVANE